MELIIIGVVIFLIYRASAKRQKAQHPVVQEPDAPNSHDLIAPARDAFAVARSEASNLRKNVSESVNHSVEAYKEAREQQKLAEAVKLLSKHPDALDEAVQIYTETA